MSVELSDEHATFTVQRQVKRQQDVSESTQHSTIDVHFTHLHTRTQVSPPGELNKK